MASSWGFLYLYLSSMTYSQLSKRTNRIEWKIGFVVSLVVVGKFLVQEFCYGD